MIAQTNRLFLREFKPVDATFLYLLNKDPEVLQYTGDKAFESIDAAALFIKKYDHYQKYGLGRWAVIGQWDQSFLGWCGLKYSPDLDEYDIGFRFFKTHWNKGYASEAAELALSLGFNRYHLNKIVGRVMKANIASIKVLEKIGLQFKKNIDFDGQEGLLYHTTALARKGHHAPQNNDFGNQTSIEPF